MKFLRIACLAMLAITVLIIPTSLLAAGERDTSSNAMIKGGAYSTSELRQKINANSSLKADFSSVGITSSELTNENLVNGTVTKDGRVIVNNKTIATNAHSYGRENLPGSTREDRGLYSRPTSVSFEQQSLPAYVRMNNGQFEYAIIKSCGNYVKATPKAAPKPVKPVEQPAPQPAPVVIQPVAVQPQPAPQPLPQTGPEAAGAALGGSALVTAAMYWRRSRLALATAAKQAV